MITHCQKPGAPRWYVLRVLSALVVAWLVATASRAHADDSRGTWNVSAFGDVASQAVYRRTSDEDAVLTSISATTGFKISPRQIPLSLYGFVEYAHGLDRHVGDVLRAGTGFKYRFSRWNTAFYGFYTRANGGDVAWAWANISKFRLSDRQQFGLETYGYFGDATPPWPILAYYADIAPAVSLKLKAAPTPGFGSGYVAGIEFAWSIK